VLDRLRKTGQINTASDEGGVKRGLEESKTTSLADIMKEEMQKSLGSMATKIQTVKTNLTDSKVYKVLESTVMLLEQRKEIKRTYLSAYDYSTIHCKLAS